MVLDWLRTLDVVTDVAFAPAFLECSEPLQDIESADRQRYDSEMEAYTNPRIKAAREEKAIAGTYTRPPQHTW